MSRGLGKLQRGICEYLAASAAPVTYETLRWELLDQRKQANSPARLRDGRLPATWNSSLTRALDGLADDGERRVTIERRNLESMAEFVRHYPGKSLIASTRRLRLELLPALAAIVGTNKQHPRYTPVENESFYLKTYPAAKRARLQKAWTSIEPDLAGQLPGVTGEDRANLFLLIARAKSLFEEAPLECHRSIDQCVQPLVGHGVLPPALENKLTAFSAFLLPSREIGFLHVKSCIRCFADIPRRGRGYRLKPETLNSLEDECRAVVEKLPGYEYHPRPKKKTSVWMMSTSDEASSTHSPEIHKLIDKTVFETFRFLRLA
jgi:hypothetical protein